MASESKTEILEALRTRSPDTAPLPELQGEWIEYDDRLEQFSQIIQAVGGQAVVVRDHAELLAKLAEQPAYDQARQICSLVEGIPRVNVDLEAIEDPHELETVDFCIAPGQFAVAENGAVWLDDTSLKHRVLYFITQHLALVVPAAEILDNMHQAYARLSFDRPQFGLFLSGPSKTADIEQSLVIGAHGARSLTVFLMQ